jgi:hypothetical protein
MAAESRSQTSIGSRQSDQAARSGGGHVESSDAEKLSPSQPPPGSSAEDEDFDPRNVRFWLTLLCNFMALFLVALDRTIIATAVPRISDEFQALGDIGWYGSSYMLTTACAQLVFGRIYKFYDMKWYVNVTPVFCACVCVCVQCVSVAEFGCVLPVGPSS